MAGLIQNVKLFGEDIPGFRGCGIKGWKPFAVRGADGQNRSLEIYQTA